MTIQGIIDNPQSENGEHWVVGRDYEEALENASQKFNVKKEKIILKQDEDVLDTWFSSGLLPFTSLGWPDVKCKDFTN